ncbi:DUF5011 domain-containing protein, partial [Colwellia echini]
MKLSSLPSSKIQSPASKLLTPLLLSSVLVLSACGGSDSAEPTPTPTPTPTPDTTAPVITLNGDSTITHGVGSEYIDAGASA